MKDKNIIGTDISLEVCRGEGYMMLDTEGHKKLDPNYPYRVFCTYPAYLESEGLDISGFAIETRVSWTDALEMYDRHKESIDSYADDMPDLMSTKEPDFWHLVSACSTINSYCGLD